MQSLMLILYKTKLLCFAVNAYTLATLTPVIKLIQELYWLRKKNDPTLKIHGDKSISQIELLKFLLKAKRSQYFCDFSHGLNSTRNIGKIQLYKHFMDAK